MTDTNQHSDPVECDGSSDCKAEQHILGCFAGPKEQNQHRRLSTVETIYLIYVAAGAVIAFVLIAWLA